MVFPYFTPAGKPKIRASFLPSQLFQNGDLPVAKDQRQFIRERSFSEMIAAPSSSSSDLSTSLSDCSVCDMISQQGVYVFGESYTGECVPGNVGVQLCELLMAFLLQTPESTDMGVPKGLTAPRVPNKPAE